MDSLKRFGTLALGLAVTGVAGAATFSDDFSVDTSGNYVSASVLRTAGANGTTVYGIDVADSNLLNVSEANHSGNANQSASIHQTAQLGIGETVRLDLPTIATDVFGSGTAGVGLILSSTATPTEAPSPAAATDDNRNEQGLLYAYIRSSGSLLVDVFGGGLGGETQNGNTLADILGVFVTRVDVDTYDIGVTTAGGDTVHQTRDHLGLNGNVFIGIGSDSRSSALDVNVDNLRIVPEPGSLALLGLGGLMIARRRRG